MTGFTSFDIYHVKLAWDASMELLVSTTYLRNEAQQLDGEERRFVLRKGSEQALYSVAPEIPGARQALDHRDPLFNREFIERVTRGETRLFATSNYSRAWNLCKFVRPGLLVRKVLLLY
jgi:hypothetical protein